MTDGEDDKIKKLNVKFKAPPSEDAPTLQVVQHYERDGCNHKWVIRGGRTVHASYLIREGETEVECGLCNTRLDPMFVLRHLAFEEANWHRTRQAYQDEMKRLNERRRTKCDNCGHMTRISRS